MMGNVTAAMTETVSQPVAPVTRRRWYTPVITGELEALWPAIVILFVGVLLIAFGLSFHGLFEFGRRIMMWPDALCAAAPLGLDVFSLVGLLATFLTHDARWRVRVYCWAAFGFTVALSVVGNAISAYALLDTGDASASGQFVWGYRQVSAVSGAAIWPALSAVALHVLIVVRRHLDWKRDNAGIVADRAAKEAAAEQLLQARAIMLAATGATASAIVDELEIDPAKRRTVERWTEPIRAARARTATAVLDDPSPPRASRRPRSEKRPKDLATTPDIETVNGRSPVLAKGPR